MLDARKCQKVLQPMDPIPVMKFRFVNGKTAHVVFNKFNQRLRFAIAGPGRISERDPGLINFGDGAVTDLSNDGIRGIDQIGMKIGKRIRLF